MIKFLQINTYKGRYLDNLLQFINEIAPDFISMQEVTSGAVNLSGNKVDLFDFYKKSAGMDGIREVDFTTLPIAGSFGNAVFSRHKILSASVVRLLPSIVKDTKDLDNPETFPTIPRHLLEARVDFNGREMAIMGWHGAWTAPPTDTEETKRQADIVCARLDYLNSHKIPFLLGGDLNATIESYTVREVEKRAVNLMRGISVKATTHPKIHKIVPRGFLVDYIFTSSNFKVKKIEVPLVTISDHLPVYAQLEG